MASELSLDDRVKLKAKNETLSRDWLHILHAPASSSQVHPSYSPASLSDYSQKHLSFPTHSQYLGSCNVLGMSHIGTYVIWSSGQKVVYEGELWDGMFHGEGTLTYPMVQKIDGEWVKGKLVSFKFRFEDGLEYDTPWKYCTMPDRRFYTSIQEGMRPAGRSFLTNQHPPRKIPEGCYDTGDGFYNPKTKCVMSASKPGKILRIPTATEEKWIMENCRKAWDEPTGYRPDLFEHWVSGRSTDSALASENDAESSSTSDSFASPDISNDSSSSDASFNWWAQNVDAEEDAVPTAAVKEE